MITVGEVLKKQRENLNKSIEQVALDTKIQPRFLEYIEADDFKSFDSAIYAQGFIKIYAKYLDLNEDRILAIYRRSRPLTTNSTQTLRETEKESLITRITPKLIAILLSSVFLLGILFYIAFQIYQFQTPPVIKILSPENQQSIFESTVEVKGTTDSNSTLFINDTPVEIDSGGAFSYLVELNPGVNLITVLAKKDNSTQESIETINVTYLPPPNTDEEVAVEESVINKIKLEIVNSSVWIQLNVDRINKLAQILQIGQEFEYEVEEEFSLTTGIINSTKIYFNDEELSINRGNNSIGTLNCEITDKDQIKCE